MPSTYSTGLGGLNPSQYLSYEQQQFLNQQQQAAENQQAAYMNGGSPTRVIIRAQSSGNLGGASGGQPAVTTTNNGFEMRVADEKIPLFLAKLWKIVEDPLLQPVVRWDETGFSFHITDPYAFCKHVLPQYFKHNNLNSLIRQLNMYGFRKITAIERSGLHQAESDHEHLEFQHPFFVRGHPELLAQIKRKAASGSGGNGGGATAAADLAVTNRGVSHLLDEVRQQRERHIAMDAKLGQLSKENETLWREVAQMRGMHAKQQQIVNKLIQFLVSVVQPSGQKRLGKRQLLAIGPDEAKRRRLHSGAGSEAEMLDELQKELQQSTSPIHGPIIADVTDDPDEPHRLSSPHHQRVTTASSSPVTSARAWDNGSGVGGGVTGPLIGENVVLGGGGGGGGGSTGRGGGGAEWQTRTPSPLDFDFAGLSPSYHHVLSAFDGSPMRPLTNGSGAQHLMGGRLDGSASPSLLPNTADWTINLGDFFDNRQLPAELGGGGVGSEQQTTVDADALRDLFSICDQATLESAHVVSTAPLFGVADGGGGLVTTAAPGGGIVGNELALYQRPNLPFSSNSAANVATFPVASDASLLSGGSSSTDGIMGANVETRRPASEGSSSGGSRLGTLRDHRRLRLDTAAAGGEARPKRGGGGGGAAIPPVSTLMSTGPTPLSTPIVSPLLGGRPDWSMAMLDRHQQNDA